MTLNPRASFDARWLEFLSTARAIAGPAGPEKFTEDDKRLAYCFYLKGHCDGNQAHLRPDYAAGYPEEGLK